jgi:glycosyltransferase involved in cell wall biosynthesis
MDQHPPLVSVVLCTHNPRRDYFERTLAGLQEQTLRYEKWELLIIDNASVPPLLNRMDLGWHPGARLVEEARAGLTPARLRGIQETRSGILIFVDDDAVLNTDYLEKGLEIGNKYTLLGAWGGSVQPEFEAEPPEWTRTYWPRLAIRTITKGIWSNFAGYPDTTPWGVGMCVRRAVAAKYREQVLQDPLRHKLDRSGSSLVSGGDDDIARTAHGLGLGTGLFPELQLTHLIPASRLEENYLLRLVEGQSYSGVIVNALHGHAFDAPLLNSTRIVFGRLRRYLTMSIRERRFFEARLNGQQRALLELSRQAPRLLRHEAQQIR